jgi:hypothetical protein
MIFIKFATESDG